MSEREEPARLTEEERLNVGERICWECAHRDVWAEVERILTDRRAADAATIADLRERLAAVGAVPDEWDEAADKWPYAVWHDQQKVLADDLRRVLAGEGGGAR